MGLDVKEKALLQFIAKVLLPLALVLVPLVVYTGIWEHPLWALGLLTAVVKAIKLLKYLVERLTRRPKRVTTYGQWAIVTGTHLRIACRAGADCIARSGTRHQYTMMISTTLALL